MEIVNLISVLLSLPVKLLGIILTATAILWVLFVITYKISKWGERQAGIRQLIVKGIVFAFVTIDVVYNAVIGSIIFMQLPTGRKFILIETFSERVKEAYRSQVGWRYRLSDFFRKMILRVDPEHF